MTESINRAMLLGVLERDPELRYTQNNTAVSTLRIETTERARGKAGEPQRDRSEWHTVIVWGKRAENLQRVLHKGARVLCEGKLTTRSYEDRSGAKRYVAEIVATSVLVLDGPAAQPSHADLPHSQPQERDAGAAADDDIPF